jgi:hypothetical protein
MTIIFLVKLVICVSQVAHVAFELSFGMLV